MRESARILIKHTSSPSTLPHHLLWEWCAFYPLRFTFATLIYLRHEGVGACNREAHASCKKICLHRIPFLACIYDYERLSFALAFYIFTKHCAKVQVNHRNSQLCANWGSVLCLTCSHVLTRAILYLSNSQSKSEQSILFYCFNMLQLYSLALRVNTLAILQVLCESNLFKLNYSFASIN